MADKKKTSSQGESFIEDFLTVKGIKFEREYRINEKSAYRWDFYLSEENTVIDYDGGQHFFEDDFFFNGRLVKHGAKELADQKYRDLKKMTEALEAKLKVIKIDCFITYEQVCMAITGGMLTRCELYTTNSTLYKHIIDEVSKLKKVTKVDDYELKLDMKTCFTIYRFKGRLNIGQHLKYGSVQILTEDKKLITALKSFGFKHAKTIMYNNDLGSEACKWFVCRFCGEDVYKEMLLSYEQCRP